MRIYLDTCCFNRPFDDASQDRIALESKAVQLIFAHCNFDDWQLISSTVLVFEVAQTSDPERRFELQRFLGAAAEIIMVDEGVRTRACEWESIGIRPLDALHLAAAEKGRADVFCTCDDRLLARCRGQSLATMRILSPIELIKEPG